MESDSGPSHTQQKGSHGRSGLVMGVPDRVLSGFSVGSSKQDNNGTGAGDARRVGRDGCRKQVRASGSLPAVAGSVAHVAHAEQQTHQGHRGLMSARGCLGSARAGRGSSCGRARPSRIAGQNNPHRGGHVQGRVAPHLSRPLVGSTWLGPGIDGNGRWFSWNASAHKYLREFHTTKMLLEAHMPDIPPMATGWPGMTWMP